LKAAAAAALLAAALSAHAGDAARGAMLYEARCTACHSPQADRIGPRHAGVVGRRAGSVPGYDYSPALAAATFRWDAKSLERWLADPEAVVPGQKMGYRVGEAKDREDLVAFLSTLR
jgi:cytochrome c